MSQISSSKPKPEPVELARVESACAESATLEILSAGGSAFSPAYTRDGRLRRHADYQRAYQASRKQFSSSMTWFLARREPAPADPHGVSGAAARVGLTAGKVLGKAHERNRIKRRMRELVRRHFSELPEGYDLILHPRRHVMTMDFGKLDAEVLRIFRQAAAQASAARNAAQ
jgi:ribonuclease P protein component